MTGQTAPLPARGRLDWPPAAVSRRPHLPKRPRGILRPKPQDPRGRERIHRRSRGDELVGVSPSACGWSDAQCPTSSSRTYGSTPQRPLRRSLLGALRRALRSAARRRASGGLLRSAASLAGSPLGGGLLGRFLGGGFFVVFLAAVFRVVFLAAVFFALFFGRRSSRAFAAVFRAPLFFADALLRAAFERELALLADVPDPLAAAPPVLMSLGYDLSSVGIDASFKGLRVHRHACTRQRRYIKRVPSSGKCWK